MAILPRNLLKSFFETGDKPNESQFGSLIDSMLHSTEDQEKLGLRTYAPGRTYVTGEAVIYDSKLFQAIAITTGAFNAADWQEVSSPGSLLWESYTSGAGEAVRLDSSSYTGITPGINSGADLGISATRWRDLYISGNIDFSSALAVKLNSSTVATFHENGLKVGGNNGSGLPHLSVDATDVAGKLYTMNNNSTEASVIGNYLPGNVGMAMILTGSSYAGTGMMTGNRSVLVSESHNFNIGTSTANDLGIWTDNTERISINATGRIIHNGETAFGQRTYYLDGAVDTNIDWSKGNTFYKVIESDITFTFSNDVDLQTIVIGLEQGGAGSYSITWPPGIKWPNATIPTPTPTLGKTDVYTFVRMNGVIHGNVIQNF